jgi:hypothetical protein
MKVERADEMEPGLITHQVIERVVNADLVVVDLAGPNPNVMYELALFGTSRAGRSCIWRQPDRNSRST